MRKRMVLVVVALAVLGAAVGLVADRATQHGRVDDVLARIPPLEAAVAAGTLDPTEATTRALYYETLAIEDRWVRSGKNAVAARLRDLIDRIERTRREGAPTPR